MVVREATRLVVKRPSPRLRDDPAEVWDAQPSGLEWTVPSPAPYHTFDKAPEVR